MMSSSLLTYACTSSALLLLCAATTLQYADQITAAAHFLHHPPPSTATDDDAGPTSTRTLPVDLIPSLISSSSLSDTLLVCLASLPAMLSRAAPQSLSLSRYLGFFCRSRLNLVIFVNFVFSLFLFLLSSFASRVFGPLSDTERKACRDSLFQFLVFRSVFLAALVPLNVREIAVWVTLFAIIAALNLIAVIARERFASVTILPSATPRAFLELLALLVALMIVHCCIGAALTIFLYQRVSLSVLLLILYEPLVSLLLAAKLAGKYYIHVSGLSGRVRAWEERQALLVRCEFSFEATALLVTSAHYLHVWTFYGLSVTIIDLILFLHLRSAALTLVDRCSKFVHYRRAAAAINDRYPDATPEELRDADDFCAICRESMEHAKKLACNHLFHKACITQWMEYKSICPSCRAPLVNANPSAHTQSQPQQRPAARTGPSHPPSQNQSQHAAAPRTDEDLEATYALIRRLQAEDAAALGGLGLGAVMAAAERARLEPSAEATSAMQRSSSRLFHFDSRAFSNWLPAFSVDLVTQSQSLPPQQPQPQQSSQASSNASAISNAVLLPSALSGSSPSASNASDVPTVAAHPSALVSELHSPSVSAEDAEDANMNAVFSDAEFDRINDDSDELSDEETIASMISQAIERTEHEAQRQQLEHDQAQEQEAAASQASERAASD